MWFEVVMRRYKDPKYYSVLKKYYSVLLLQSTTLYYKVLLRTTKYYNSITPYYKVLLCTTKFYSVLQSSHETSNSMCGATRIILQLHQILRLPRKMNLMIDQYPRIKRPVECAEHQESPSKCTKYCACHEK